MLRVAVQLITPHYEYRGYSEDPSAVLVRLGSLRLAAASRGETLVQEAIKIEKLECLHTYFFTLVFRI